MKSQLNSLIYLFDDLIADTLGYSHEDFVKTIDSMNDDDMDFVMSSVFEFTVAQETNDLTDRIIKDFEEACEMFAKQYEINSKKVAK